MTAWPVDILLKASALLLLAAAVDWMLRRRASAAARHLVWTIAIAATLALPPAVTMLPSWSVAISVAARPAVAPALTASPTAPMDRGESGFSPTTVAPALPAPARRPPFDPLAFGVALYSAGVALLLVRLAAEQLALARLARRSRMVDAAGWLAIVDDAARRLRIRRPVRILQVDDEVMPFTFGTLRPAIVLPAAASRWPADRRRAVILHELAHVARADCFAQRLATLACALYWPHPGIWWAARRLRIERELACDDRVLSMGAAPREYAADLLEIAHAFRANQVPTAALGMARARQLETRLLALMDGARNRDALDGRRRAAAVAASFVLLLPIASLRAAFVPAAGTAPAERAGLPSVPAAQPTPSRAAADDRSGTWELRLTSEPGVVHVNLRSGQMSTGRTLPLSRFEGVTGPGMTAASRNGRIVDGMVHFDHRRDAGTFTFEGVCRNQMCGGTFTFTANPAFAAELARRGVGTPDALQQFQLALENVGVAYLGGLKANGYALPDVHTLVRAAQHGVSLDYVRTMADFGHRLGTLDPLIRLRDHGVDPEYVRGMAAEGHARVSADDLVRLRDHGVDPQYVKGMRDLGVAPATVDDLVDLRDRGVDPAFVRGMAAAGYRNLSRDALARARDHGADPEFASGLAALGYRSLPLDTLVNARDHGVDPTYAGGLAALGYRNLPLDSLIRARDHGVDGAYVGGLAALGYKDLPIETLIRLHDHGVDPQYVRSLQQRGVERLSVDELIRRRDRGEDDPEALAHAALAALKSYCRAVVAWMRG